MKTNNNNSQTSPLTEQGSLMIQVYVKDLLANEIVDTKWIKRAELARMFHEHKVVGSHNHKFVVGY